MDYLALRHLHLALALASLLMFCGRGVLLLCGRAIPRPLRWLPHVNDTLLLAAAITLMVWSGQSIYAWHVNRLIAPNERTTDAQRKRVGYFVFHNDQWWLVNEGINGLMSLPDKRQIAIGEKIELTNNAQFVLSKEEGGRLVVVQLVEN